MILLTDRINNVPGNDNKTGNIYKIKAMTKTKDMFHEEREQYERRNEAHEFEHGNELQSTGLTLTPKKLQDLDKEGITDLAKAVVLGVTEGVEDAMDTLIMAKKLELLGKGIVDNVKDYAYGKQYATKGNPYQRFGAKVEAAELATSYDYSGCNDRELDWLQFTFDSAKSALDARKKFLQTLPKTMSVNDTNTGEVYEIHPAIKTSQSGYKINL